MELPRDSLGALGGQGQHLIGAQLVQQRLAGGVGAVDDGVDPLYSHGLEVHDGVGAHGAAALHHGGVDLLPLQPCLLAQTEGMHGGGAGAGEDRHGGGIQGGGDLHQIGQGGVVDLGVAAPEVGGLLDASAVGDAHVHAVGVVTRLAQKALAAGDGDVGDDVVSDGQTVLLGLGGVAVGKLAHELVANDGGGAYVQGPAPEVEVGAADT